MHDPAQFLLRSLRQEMHVIGHQDEDVEQELAGFGLEDLLEEVLEEMELVRALEEGSLGEPPVGDVL